MPGRKRSSDQGHGRLEEGRYRHTCCSQRRERELPIWIDDDPGQELVTHARVYRCDHGIWDFSIMLRSWNTWANQITEVIRFCVAHRNYHIHVRPWLTPDDDLAVSYTHLTLPTKRIV